MERCPTRRSCGGSNQDAGDVAGGHRRAPRSASSRRSQSFNIPAQVIGTVSGPRVTRYELQLAPGIKVGKVANLKDDLKYALAATEVRVLAPIPGKTAVGVEVPNIQASYVSLGDVHGPFQQHASPMSFWLGMDVTGKPVMADLVRLVHLLIAGTTGSGKSGCLNALITSILLRATPDEVRMIMIDPKKVELSNFNGVPHLLAPVVTNMKQATYVLDNICREMDRRYDVLSRNGVQDIRELNKKLARVGEEAMPYTMVIIDELADLMMVAPSEVEDSIIRLGQLGRSCGIHLVVATQRPSVDVVTGMIKTNIPSRIAFAVSSQTDSPHHPRPGWRREPARHGRHALLPDGQQQAPARAGRPGDERRDEARHRALEAAGQARVPRGAAREPGRAGRRAADTRRPAATSSSARPSRPSSTPARPASRCCSGACAWATRAPAGSSTSWRRWASSPATTAARPARCSSSESGLPAALARLSGEVIDEPPAAADDEPAERRGAGGAAGGGRAGARRRLNPRRTGRAFVFPRAR